MREIFLNTFGGEQLKVNVVRYFESEGKKYLVYTLNEKDTENYLRLYVGEVTVNGGVATINIIADENQWAAVKMLFKGIISANRENRPIPVKDLDINELTNGMLNSYRVFKLLTDMAAILAENSDVSGEQMTMEQPKPFAFDATPTYEMPKPDFGSATDDSVNMAPFTMPTPEPVATPVENTTSIPFDFGNPVPNQDSVTTSYEAPVAPSYEVPTTYDYEMPVPTPEVKEFAPAEPVAPTVEEAPESDLKAELDEAKEKIEDLMFENAELRSKIETIKLLLK